MDWPLSRTSAIQACWLTPFFLQVAMYSFMATCKKNGVDEIEWLTDVFERIQDHKQKDLYQLLPNNWGKYKPSLKI